MKKIPICLNIDDGAPVLSVYYQHAKNRTTADGRPLLKTFPNSFLYGFCDTVERWGLKGKLSIVPMPGNEGNLVDGLQGVDKAELEEWLQTVQTRLIGKFSFCPEMLTHYKAVDLTTGENLELDEVAWSNLQNRDTLTPYISCALNILKNAGFSVCGVSSPWSFGLQVEQEYVEAISQAVYDVTGKKNAWYFLHQLVGEPNAKPWVALEKEDRTVICIPETTGDCFWQTIDCPRTDEAYVCTVADELITADGKDGAIIRALDNDSYPIIFTHWQSLISNGLQTGLRVLNEVGRRVQAHLSDRVEWTSFEQIVDSVLENKSAFAKPIIRGVL